MFGIAPSELILVALVALVLIAPRDLPRAMRFTGQWIGRGRALSRHLRLTVDQLIQEAEGAEPRRDTVSVKSQTNYLSNHLNVEN